ncbi:MAG TPA: phosphoserine phosphatase SerB [Acidimicrobiales bacterium]|nr:phosphoserine phosphatase SerB [Acidimicrobiales bacterium]|tara:strand:- start:791 stop:1975 length:1185 start_codon:yes stop_codon:yes gene_type:complete
MTKMQTVLVRVSGPDQLGISAELFDVLAGMRAVVHDVEQIVVRRRLALDVLIEVEEGDDVLKDLLLFGFKRNLQINVEEVEDDPTEYSQQFVVTLIGEELSPAELREATVAIANGNGNIDRIVRLSRYPVMSYELAVNGGDITEIRKNLLNVASVLPKMDVAIQPLNLSRRAKRLVILDVDSTLIQDEVIDLLAVQAGCEREVSEITDLAMRGKIDFAEALLERVSLLKGLDELAIERAWHELTLTPGARTFCRTLGRLGFTTAIVSGGFSIFTDRLQKELGIQHGRANHLEIVNGRLTGELTGPIVDRRAKADFLKEIAAIEGVPIEQTVAIGDGANDLDMLSEAGLGIAFNAKPIVRDAANTSLRVPYLDAVLFLLGVSREEIEAADSLDFD